MMAEGIYLLKIPRAFALAGDGARTLKISLRNKATGSRRGHLSPLCLLQRVLHAILMALLARGSITPVVWMA